MIDLVILCAVLALAVVALTLTSFAVFLLAMLLVPIALAAIVVVWFIEWRGVELARRRFGKLEMPIITLREMKTGNYVRLIGVVHIAEAAYWKKLSDLIDEYPHVAVLYEGISKVSEEEKLRFTDKELETWKQYADVGSAMKELSELMGLTFQKDGLAYPPHWIRTDMTGFDFVRSISAATEQKDTIVLAPRWTKEIAPLVHWMLRMAIGHMPIISLLFGKRKSGDKKRAVIIGTRNFIGCEAISKYRNTGDVISIWGGGHLPGMVHLLTQMGYEVLDRKWHEVIDGTSYSLLHALADMNAEMKRAAEEESERKQSDQASQ